MTEQIQVIINASESLKKFKKYERDITDFTAANREVSVQLYSTVIRRFETGGSSSGRPWAPLKPRTAAAKAKAGYSPIPLTRTGVLRGSFFPGFYSAKEAGVRSRVPYAVYHQEGVSERNLPARPMLPDEKEVVKIATKVYEDHAARAKKRADL